MEEKKLKYEPPFTKLVQVEMESGICAASQPGDPVNRDDGSRHITINKQPTQDELNFSNNSWD